jgi:hypothetical protein
VPFSKNSEGDVVLGETLEMDVQVPLFLAPVFAVWAELWPDEFRDSEHETTHGTA